MDRISIRNIVAHGKHGANPGERDREQPFHLEIDLDLDLSNAGKSDELDDTINYADVYALAMRIVEERSYVLLERVASEIASEILDNPLVQRASVTIGKPGLLDGATPFVRITRERAG
ncbi:MAG TPA: dihydroneopterin aldolase [Candidatus Aquilonibacter sp.]|nr:dihydroneopterin aldolase [Candidatus Aquilonibacter sp.]